MKDAVTATVTDVAMDPDNDQIVFAVDDNQVFRSINGGSTWTTLAPAGGYPNTIPHGGNACQAMPSGTPAFSSDNQFTWQQKSVNLSAYAGQTVRIAWRYGSDINLNGDGWYVDDIALTHAQIPGSCVSNLLFADGFASGNSGAWSATAP